MTSKRFFKMLLAAFVVVAALIPLPAMATCGITVDTVIGYCEYRAYPGGPVSQRTPSDPCQNTDEDLYLKMYLSPGCKGESGVITVTIARPDGHNIARLKKPQYVAFPSMSQEVVALRVRGIKLLVGDSKNLLQTLQLKIVPVSATDAAIAEHALYDLPWLGKYGN